MDGLKTLFNKSLPSYYNMARRHLSDSLDHFNNRDAYYTNDDTRLQADIPKLLRSKYDEEVKEGLKFLMGVCSLINQILAFFSKNQIKD